MAKIPVVLVGRGTYLCHECPGEKMEKRTGVPHCTDCGKHHPIHHDCKGRDLTPPPIDYIQMFYGIPKMEVGKV